MYQKKPWAKPWFTQREPLGFYNNLIYELKTDVEEYTRFLRMPPYFFDELLELTETDIRDLTNSRRPYLGLLKMTFFSNNLLKFSFYFVSKKFQDGINVSAGKHTNMASFHEAQLQLNAFSENINEKKFLLLEDINSSKNKEPPYYNYD